MNLNICNYVMKCNVMKMSIRVVFPEPVSPIITTFLFFDICSNNFCFAIITNINIHTSASLLRHHHVIPE